MKSQSELEIKDEEATPAMWFLLEVFSKALFGPTYEIEEKQTA